jgi:multimeric flavodoxin WrbA
MTTMNIVAIAGGPRKLENSTSLMQVAVDAALARGADAEVFCPVEMDISGCLGCLTCQKTSDAVCRTKDDMFAICEAIKTCDALVLAGPVYFYGLSSWLKAVVDRCFALITPPEPPDAEGEGVAWPQRVAPGKALYLITTQHASWPMYGYQILSTVANGSKLLGMECRGELIATKLGNSDDRKSRPELVAQAQRLIQVCCASKKAGRRRGFLGADPVPNQFLRLRPDLTGQNRVVPLWRRRSRGDEAVEVEAVPTLHVRPCGQPNEGFRALLGSRDKVPDK